MHGHGNNSDKETVSKQARECEQVFAGFANFIKMLPGPPSAKQVAAMGVMVAAMTQCRNAFPNHRPGPPPPPPAVGT